MGWFSVNYSTKRIYGLDILRCVAILFVVYGHSLPYILTIWPGERWLSFGVWDGVSIFFVLSGFLIGGLLIKTLESEGSSFSSLIHFWLRRWFRTLPNYFLILTLLFVGQGLILGKYGWDTLWKYLLFIQNFTDIHPHFFPEAWSLSIEEWFYILVPLSAFLLVKAGLKPRWTLLIIIILLILCITYVRWDTYWDWPGSKLRFKDWDNFFRKRVLTRLDSLMWGVLGAWLNYYYHQAWLRHKKLKLLAGLILMLLYKGLMHFRVDLGWGFNTYYAVWSFTIMSVGTLWVIPYLSQVKSGSGWIYQKITLISLISYSMYLINLTPVQEVLLKAFYKVVEIPDGVLKNILSFGLVWVLTIGISILLYKYFERPMTQIRENLSLAKVRKTLKNK